MGRPGTRVVLRKGAGTCVGNRIASASTWRGSVWRERPRCRREVRQSEPIYRCPGAHFGPSDLLLRRVSAARQIDAQPEGGVWEQLGNKRPWKAAWALSGVPKTKGLTGLRDP